MRFKKLFLMINQCRIYIKPRGTFSNYKHYTVSAYNKCFYSRTNFISTTTASQNSRIDRENGSFDEEIDIDYNTTFKWDEECARDLLYKNSKDLLLTRIYCCASIQELFNVFNNNQHSYKAEHITQTIFVLYDLHKIYQDVSMAVMKKPRLSSNEFIETLQQNKSFQQLLSMIKENIHSFDINTLSYSLLYLNKIGLSIGTPTMEIICKFLKENLMKNFSISAASKFLETVFSESNTKSYFMSQELIPLVIKQIDECTSAATLYDLSISLNKLHNVITEETVDKYKKRSVSLINNKSLRPSDYKAILQVISFLNYPKWRDKNSALISRCIMLMQSSLYKLNINEIVLVYEIFFRLQEPGDILNDVQRCSSKYFHQLDDTPTAQKISLFSTLIYFASPSLRNEFQNVLRKYVEECDDYDNLLLLRKLLSYIKISDKKLCQLYWNKMLKFVRNMNENVDLIKVSQNYINFSTDVDNYRHLEFEVQLLKSFENLIKEYEFFPQKLASILNFFLLYGENTAILDYLVEKMEANWGQLRHMECLKMCYTLKIFNEMDKNYVKRQYARRINKVMDKLIEKEVRSMNGDLWKNSALLKSCVYKNKADTVLMNKLLNNFKSIDHISSKNIENLYYCFFMTNTLIPEVIDNVIEYIITYKNHLLGFNVGRIIYLCYCLGYHPKKLHEFCDTATDIIIRDQKRMSGLLTIYSALALCFFNKLPNSLIKSIFNVEFMDTLDKELHNCYSRDKYPQRVRNHLMQLNRAVCLEYPESNVPWFHQKYVEEMFAAKPNKPSLFANKVREYLRGVVQNSNALTENVSTPYGYEVDFVINLAADDEIAIDESYCTKKLALLLIPEYAYTRIISQLRGNLQLKRRHLEILGYKVIFIKFSDWIGLFYADERVDFLRRLIWPKKFCTVNKETDVR